MLSSVVTCSKNTPSEWRAGDVTIVLRRPSANSEMEAESPSPRPSIVMAAQPSNPLACAAAAA